MRSGGTQARHAILYNLLGNRPWFLKLGCTDPAGMDREPGSRPNAGEFSVLRSRLAARPVHDVAPGQERVPQNEHELVTEYRSPRAPRRIASALGWSAEPKARARSPVGSGAPSSETASRSSHSANVTRMRSAFPEPEVGTAAARRQSSAFLRSSRTCATMNVPICVGAKPRTVRIGPQRCSPPARLSPRDPPG